MHGKIEVEAVPGFPSALDAGEAASLERDVENAAVEVCRGTIRPARNAQQQRKRQRAFGLDANRDSAVEWVVGLAY